MNWIDRVLRRSGLVPYTVTPAEEPRPRMTSPWTDLGATTMIEEASIRRPINIRRSMFPTTRYLAAGDTLKVRLTTVDEDGSYTIDETPEFDMERDVAVDSITKFEVIDEFGVDVGIGFVLGQAKQPNPSRA